MMDLIMLIRVVLRAHVLVVSLVISVVIAKMATHFICGLKSFGMPKK